VTRAGEAGAASIVGRAPELHVVDAAVRRLMERDGGALRYRPFRRVTPPL
jgi:hypothetical protein